MTTAADSGLLMYYPERSCREPTRLTASRVVYFCVTTQPTRVNKLLPVYSSVRLSSVLGRP